MKTKNILLVIASFLLAMLLIGCGARKAEVHKSDTDKTATTSTASETHAEQHTVATTGTQNDIVRHDSVIETADNLVFTPVNNELPIMVVQPGKDTLKVYNAKIERNRGTRQASAQVQDKSATQQTVTTDTNVTDKQQSKTATSEHTTTKDKATDRKASYDWIIWLIIIAAVVYFGGRWLLKKYKMI